MAMIDDAYAWFLDLVVERRKMDRERARKLADGRIYSGGMAVENGLVDALGSEREAVAWLETEAGIPADLDVVDENPSTPGRRVRRHVRIDSRTDRRQVGLAIATNG